MSDKKFRPDVLVSVGEDLCTGIADEIYLEGLIMKACSKHNIDRPNAFMYCTGIKEGEAADKYGKIQDTVFFKAFASVCSDNDCINRKECHAGDAEAAEYLLEHVEENLENYKSIKKIKNITNDKNEIIGIRYLCSKAGYDEMAFHVSLYDRTIGVFIVGQISTEENKDFFENRVNDLYKKLGRNKNEIGEIKYINDLSEIIENTKKTVEYIEKELIKQYENRQNIYSMEKSQNLIDTLNKAIPDIKEKSKAMALIYPAATEVEYYKAVCGEIKKCLIDLCNSVGAKRCSIFIPDSLNMMQGQYNKLSDGKITLQADKCIDKCIEEIKDTGYLCEDVEQYIEYGENTEDHYDFLLVANTVTYPIAAAVIRSDFLTAENLDERKLLKKSFKNIFERFASYAQKIVLEAKSEYYKAYLDSAMSIMRHEFGQSTAGHRTLTERFKIERNFFSNVIENSNTTNAEKNRFNNFIEQCDNFIEDTEKYMYVATLRTQSTKYLIDFSVKNPKYFYPYDEFLFKWNQIYLSEAENNELEFDFPYVTSFDISKPRMFGDPQMIEQAAYNLTNNAIKYAIHGTKVSLDCGLNKEKERYEITVKNIGHTIAENECDLIFEYGKRGSNNKKEGSGLGLYLTKRIAKDHGGDVELSMNKLSDYDWSMLEMYIKAHDDKNNESFCKDDILYHKLLEELKEKKSKIHEIIVNSKEYNTLSSINAHGNINKGTTEFKFTFWIPYVDE